MKISWAIVAVGLVFSGCTDTVWTKPGQSQAGANQDAAQCRLLASSMNQPTPSSDPYYALGNAIATSFNRQATWEDCIQALGYSKRTSSEQPQGLQETSSERILSATGFGAIAKDENAAIWGSSSNFATADEADNAALTDCGVSTCRLRTRFGPGQCLAIAVTISGNGWGYSVGNSRESTRTQAMQSCEEYNPFIDCVPRVSVCSS